MPKLCPHGLPEMQYIDQWELLNEGLPGLLSYWECPCHPPTSFARKVVAERRQTFLEAEAERMRAEIKSKSVESKKEEKEDSGRWYMITFTQPDTDKDPHAILERTRKVIKSKMVAPIHWCTTLELTEKGTPHTHTCLFTKKYFDYKKVCNFNDGYRAEVQREKWDVKRYVMKSASKPPAEYMDQCGLTKWHWESPEFFVASGINPPD